jgi:hypothetical protein
MATFRFFSFEISLSPNKLLESPLFGVFMLIFSPKYGRVSYTKENVKL